MAGPAWVVTRDGRVVVTNAGGRRELERDRSGTLAALVDGARGRESGLRRRRIRARGLPEYVLLVGRAREAASSVAAVAERHGLTPREREVYLAVVRGWSNRRLAAELHIAERTVETHITRILAKLGVESRSAAVALLLDADT